MSGSPGPFDSDRSSLTEPSDGGRVRLAAAILFAALACAIVGLQATLSLDLAQISGFSGSRDAGVFLAVYSLTSLGIALLALFLPPHLLALPVGLGALALGMTLVAVAATGGEAWPLLAALLTLAAGWALGRLVLRVPRLADERFADSKLVALTVGIGLLGTGVLVLGVAGWLRWWTAGLAVLVLGLLGLVQLARERPMPDRLLASLTSTRLRAAAAGLLGLQASFALVWAAAPEIQYDATQYKAWLPAVWAHTGQIDFGVFIEHPRTVYLGLLQLVQVPGHLLHAPDVGRFLDFGLAVVIVAWLWRRGDRFGRAVGPLAALIVAFVPQIVWQASTVYDDLFLGFLALGAAASVIHFEDRAPLRPLLASVVVGFLAGTCITGKITMAPFAVALAVLWCVVATDLSDLWRRAAGTLSGFLAGALPLGLYRWVESGNPIFPYFNHLFESNYFESDSGITNFTGQRGSSLSNLPDFVWRSVSDSSIGIEYAPPGFLGLLVVAIAVVMLAGWRSSAGWRVIWGTTVLATAAWWVVFRYSRFTIPFGLVAVLAMLPILARLETFLARRRAAAAAIAVSAVAGAAFFVSTVAQYATIPGHVPLAVAVGHESEAAYERRVLPDAVALEAFNRVAEPGASLVAQMWGRSLLRPDLDMEWDYWLADTLDLRRNEPVPAERMRDLLDQRGIRWVSLTGEGRQYSEGQFLGPLLESSGQIVFADHLRDIYEIVDTPVGATPVSLCDEEFQRPDCWIGANAIDDRPGLTAAEVEGLPVEQSAPACPGATYAVTVHTGAGSDPVRVFLIFDQPDPEQPFRLIDALPGRVSRYHQTAPSDAENLTVVLQPLGGNATVEGIQLAIAGASESDERCRERLAGSPT